MTTTWTPFQEKENPGVGFQPFSKARANVILKSSKLDSVTKKKVFGDVGNKIQTFDSGKRGMNNLSTKPKETSKTWVEIKSEDEVWPEPENMPACTCNPLEDDFEDVLPLGRFSDKAWINFGNVMDKFRKPMIKSMPDSPISFKPPYLPGIDLSLDLQMEPEVEVDILPPTWD